MKPTLSIVMPCYNCADTLEEAVRSIGTQGFEARDMAYEVIMVDDGSTDGTWRLIGELAKKYPHIRFLRHDKNLGGGAARNTGIRASAGEFIFCLDSDNVLAPQTLPRMAAFIREKGCGGSAFHERRFFHGDDHTKYKSHWNKIVDCAISFDDIWNGSGMLLDNFVYTRSSYDGTGGYPEHHGFDTQAFEMRFLGHGNSVRVCPDTAFYHRQRMKNKSYFERAYESGEFSRNYYLGCEDVIYLFSEQTIEAMMRFDIFNKASISGVNFKSFMDGLYASDPRSFFSPNKTVYEEGGFSAYMKAAESNREPSDMLCRGVYCFQHDMYAKSIEGWDELIRKGFDFPIIRFNRERAIKGLAGIPRAQIEADVQRSFQSFQTKPQRPLFEKKPFIIRAASAFKRMIGYK